MLILTLDAAEHVYNGNRGGKAYGLRNNFTVREREGKRTKMISL